MVWLYSGTPGSGKSYMATVRAIDTLIEGKRLICNYKLELSSYDKIKDTSKYTYVSYDNLTPEYLVDYAKINHKRSGKVKEIEGQTLLIIDECASIFNSRDFNRSDRSKWLRFFAEHRKLGYNIILITQMDRSLDRQIRGIIEYNFVHRKLSNFGWRGWIIRFLTGNDYLCKCVWYVSRIQTEVFYFKVKKKYYQAYDTFDIFDDGAEKEEKENVQIDQAAAAHEEVEVVQSDEKSDNILLADKLRVYLIP